MSEEKRSIDWSAIRAEYESGASLRALAAKYGVGKSVIGERKYKEKWIQDGQPRTDNANTGGRTRDINAAVRAKMALDFLLEENGTYDEAAAHAGFSSRGACHDAVMRELDRYLFPSVKEFRARQLYMLQKTQSRCYKAANDPENKDWTWAADRLVTLSKRISEIAGLDVKVEDAVAANITVIREVPQGYLEGPNHE